MKKGIHHGGRDGSTKPPTGKKVFAAKCKADPAGTTVRVVNQWTGSKTSEYRQSKLHPHFIDTFLWRNVQARHRCPTTCCASGRI